MWLVFKIKNLQRYHSLLLTFKKDYLSSVCRAFVEFKRGCILLSKQTEIAREIYFVGFDIVYFRALPSVFRAQLARFQAMRSNEDESDLASSRGLGSRPPLTLRSILSLQSFRIVCIFSNLNSAEMLKNWDRVFPSAQDSNVQKAFTKYARAQRLFYKDQSKINYVRLDGEKRKPGRGSDYKLMAHGVSFIQMRTSYGYLVPLI